MTALTDEQLFEKVQQKDHDSFTELRRRHLQTVIKTATWIRRDTDVDDIQQNVWMKVWMHAHRFLFQSSFKTWLTRITINESRMAGRKKLIEKNSESLEVFLGENQDRTRDEFKREAKHLARTDTDLAFIPTKLHFEEKLKCVPHPVRSVLRNLAEGKRTPEMMKKRNISEVCMKSKIYRARAAMKAVW